jgi:hypothetical protein
MITEILRLVLEQPTELEQALSLLSDYDTWADGSERPHRIRTHLVVATAWNAGRLERCREHRARGEKAPAILVCRFQLPEISLYVPSNGNHRTIAAREAGEDLINARVEGTYQVKVAGHVLHERKGSTSLWVAEGPQSHKLVASSLGPEVCAVLRTLGVATVVERIEQHQPLHPVLPSLEESHE